MTRMHRILRQSLPALAGPLTMALIPALAPPAAAQSYMQENLVSDIANPPGGAPQIIDSNLKNPWGMAYSPTSPFWVANQGTATATLYSVNGVSGAVSKVPLVVTVPGSQIGFPMGPTGQVFNGTSDFVVSAGGASGPARFIFAALNGTISGWNSGVPPPTSTQAILAVPRGTPPAVYTGLALATKGSDPFLYAANVAAGRIDVFDKTFTQVSLPPGSFTDPGLPAGDVPYNIATIGGSLYVCYANGPAGIAVVDEFGTDGHFVRRVATGGTLANPWGITLAPPGFGKFSNALLVGNFDHFPAGGNGTGWISAFDPASGNFLGLLEDPNGNPIVIHGLWTLMFGNGGSGGVPDVLYFSAGINGEVDGLFGSLTTCGPRITSESANPNLLWPPNHKMVPVTVDYTVTDACDTTPACSLSVSSNEGDGGGSGNTSPDWQVLDAHDVLLRAERAGTGSGRVYTITISCEDKLKLGAKATVAVTVPHDRR